MNLCKFGKHLNIMKYIYSLLIVLLSATTGFAQSYFLDSPTYFYEKGGAVSFRVVSGRGFDTSNVRIITPAQLNAAALYASSKPQDVLAANKEAKAFDIKSDNSGVMLMSAGRELNIDNIEREEVMRQLSDEGFSDLASKADDKEELNLKNVFCMKSLVMVGKPGGGVYSEVVGQELELVPQQNPYKLKYGEDVTVQVLFKGKPLPKAKLEIYVRTINGSVLPSETSTDNDGKAYLKLNRAGDWMLKVVNFEHLENADNKGPDYERWLSTLTFGFKQ